MQDNFVIHVLIILKHKAIFLSGNFSAQVKKKHTADMTLSVIIKKLAYT